MILISLIFAAANGTLAQTSAAAAEGAAAAVKFMISLAGTLCFWNGFMKIAENSGAAAAVQRLLMPLIGLLFPNAGMNTKKYISMNMSANLLGMGNAATPMGIKAMNEMDKENAVPEKASKNMCMLVAINTAAVQLFPTTIISLRSAAGSGSPESVTIAILAASTCGFLAAAAAVKIFIRGEKPVKGSAA